MVFLLPKKDRRVENLVGVEILVGFVWEVGANKLWSVANIVETVVIEMLVRSV